MSALTPLDFPCPKCRANQGEVCISGGGAGKPMGEPVKPHAERVALVPRKPRIAACGTRAGYQKHIREHTPTCEPCREANAESKREYRSERPADYREEVRRNRARERAVWRLARDHRETFLRYVDEELRKDGAA